MSLTRQTAGTSAYAALAKHEIKRYARHPLFIIGALLTVALCAMGPDATSSSIFHVIVPAAGLGLFGLIAMVSMVRSSEKANAAAGAGVASESVRTLALATAAVVPFTVGLLFFGWAVWAYNDSPPLDSAVPFGGVGDGWVYGTLFALGTLPAVGGPVLGLVVGRWLRFRGAAAISAVALVLVSIVMQGLVEPLRDVRVFMPWTYFSGPLGVDGDAERWLILTGSPQWYCGYLVALCVMGVLVALLHDDEGDRSRVVKALAGVGVVAVVLGVLAMTQGVQETMVNPVPSPSAGR